MTEAQGATTTEELRTEIERVLAEGQTAAASIAVVRRGEPPWFAGLGVADLASRRAATAETLFRIGSVSKHFVALAILLLVERGRLSLDDPVRALVPEVAYENRWEATNPVRVVHLLEHTTGWDDIHLREYAKDGSKMSLRDALEYGLSSRVSRWRPGTRTAYCNAGPAVAAYIVEKLSGRRFEDFVREDLFLPIGMTSATYFPPASSAAATVYQDGATLPYRYWHMLYRPSGALNASAHDMALYLQFLLNRGVARDAQVVAASSIDRMETPRSSWGAAAGLMTGYGLTSASLIREGFVWHGHSGEIRGALSELWYVPAHGIAYFTSINSENGFDSFRIGQAIRRYLTRGLSPPAPPPRASLPPRVRDVTGWYEPASPRSQLLFFLNRLTGLRRLRVEQDRLVLGDGEAARTYVAVASGHFRRVYPSGPQDPVPTLALVANDEGRFVQTGTEAETLRRVALWLVILELGLVVYVALSLAAIVLYGPVWIAGALRRRRTRSESLLHIGPLISVGTVAAAVLVASASDDPITGLGNPTLASIGLWLASLLFGFAAIAHAVILWRTRPGISRAGRRFAIAVAPALLIASGYLAYWEILGLRTWAY